MGSGLSGLYSGTSGTSQPYAKAYHVDSRMREIDVASGIYHEGHYDLNPTTQYLEDVVSGNYIFGKTYNNDNLPYAVDVNGKIVIGSRNGNGREGAPTPHPTLIGGKDPQVRVAGILKIRGGKIYSYDHRSGHYKPNIKSLEAADEAFGNLPRNLFLRNFTRREKLWD